MAKQQFTKQFKEDAIRYVQDHPDLPMTVIAKNLGIADSTLHKWKKEFKDNNQIISRGTGNYSSDDAKELASLRKELKDTKDALYILKKAIGILGE